MPAFLCLCNRRVWIGQIPCPFELRFLADAAADRFHGEVDWMDVNDETRIATVCPTCRRAHLWVQGIGAPALIYRPCAATDFEAATLTALDPDLTSFAEHYPRALPGPSAPALSERELTCACGVALPSAPRALVRRFRFMPDVELDGFGDTVDATPFFAAWGAAVLCPRCQRLHAFPARGAPFHYAPESPRDWPTCDAGAAEPEAWRAHYGEPGSS